MKTKDKKDLLTKDAGELRKMLHDSRNALFTLQIEKEQMRLKNTRSIFWRRKEIARIMSALNRKETKTVNG